MSKLSSLRKKVHYETNIPRCESCASFKKPYIFLKTNSETGRSKPLCNKHSFTVAPNACCDNWTGNDGSTLTQGKS